MTQIYCRRLMLLWWIGALPVVLILVARLMAGDRDSVPAIVTWLSTYLLPGLALVSGVALARTDGAGGEAQPDLANTFLLAIMSSLLYLLILIAAVVNVVLTTGDTPDNLLKPWGTLLGLFQTLVIGLLGRFFAKSPAR